MVTSVTNVHLAAGETRVMKVLEIGIWKQDRQVSLEGRIGKPESKQ